MISRMRSSILRPSRSSRTIARLIIAASISAQAASCGSAGASKHDSGATSALDVDDIQAVLDTYSGSDDFFIDHERRDPLADVVVSDGAAKGTDSPADVPGPGMDSPVSSESDGISLADAVDLDVVANMDSAPWDQYSDSVTPVDGAGIECEVADAPPAPHVNCAGNIDCDDQNPCTLNFCEMGLCKAICVASCCIYNMDCNDDNPCTVDLCVFNGCTECVHKALPCCVPW